MNALLWLLLWGLSGGNHTPPQHEYILISKYENIKGFVAADKIGNLYSIEKGVLHKHFPDNRIITYSQNQLGPVGVVDVSDPLTLVVLFRDFGHIALLDKNLSEKNVFGPGDFPFNDLPQMIATSSQNGFWAYFPNAGQLGKFNYQAVLQFQGVDFGMEYPELRDLFHLSHHQDRLFMAAPQGIYVFDHFAHLLFHIPHFQPYWFQVRGRQIFFMKEGSLVAYDFFLKKETVFLLPEKDVYSFFVKSSQVIYLQTPKALKKYQFTGSFY